MYSDDRPKLLASEPCARMSFMVNTTVKIAMDAEIAIAICRTHKRGTNNPTAVAIIANAIRAMGAFISLGTRTVQWATH